MTSELHRPLTLADLIDKELMGVEPDSQCIVLDDADWKMITAALRRYTIEFTRCVSCDGYNCDDGCAYPDTRAVPDVPELVRYAPIWNGGLRLDNDGEYVRYNQAAAVIAAKDAEFVSKLKEKDRQDRTVLEEISLDRWNWKERAEAAEAKLAQIEKPVAYTLVFRKSYGINAETTFKSFEAAEKYAIHCELPLSSIIPLYAAPVASDADLRAENDKLRAAAKPFAEYGLDCFDKDNTGSPLPDEQGVGWIYLNCGHFRALRAALNPSETRT